MARKKSPPADVVDVVPKQRPTKRTPEIVDTIIKEVSEGVPLAEVRRRMGIGHTTWYSWVEGDPELAERIARAREAGEEAIAADAMRIVDEPPPSTMNGSTDSGHVAWAKNRAEIRLKLLAKWNPKKWGDKVQAEHTGANGGPIQIISGQ